MGARGAWSANECDETVPSPRALFNPQRTLIVNVRRLDVVSGFASASSAVAVHQYSTPGYSKARVARGITRRDPVASVM